MATVLYVGVLAEHDLEVGEPLHLCAALGLPSASATGFNGSALTVGSVMDLQSFWSWDQAHVHDHVVETPLSWGHLQSTIVSGFGERTGALDGRFRIGSSSGVDCNLPNCYSVAPPTLFSTARLSSGSPKSRPTYGWCSGAHDPPVAAQSGHRGDDGKFYCKSCFRCLYPIRFAEKQSTLSGPCRPPSCLSSR